MPILNYLIYSIDNIFSTAFNHQSTTRKTRLADARLRCSSPTLCLKFRCFQSEREREREREREYDVSDTTPRRKSLKKDPQRTNPGPTLACQGRLASPAIEKTVPGASALRKAQRITDTLPSKTVPHGIGPRTHFYAKCQEKSA